MSMSRDWQVTKISLFRGSYSRLLRLGSNEISTFDAATGTWTNRFPLEQVLSCTAKGAEVVIETVAGGACALLCGLVRNELKLRLDTHAQAAAVSAAIKARLVRHLTAEDSERARDVAAESAVLSAAPGEHHPTAYAAAQPSSADGNHRNSNGDSATALAADDSPRYFTFDVSISIHKARNLPPPPTMAGGPMVSIHWGAIPSVGGAASSSSSSSSGGGGAAAGGERTSRRGSVLSNGAYAHADATPHAPLTMGEGAFGTDGEEEEGMYAPVRCTTAAGDGDPCNPRWSFEACFRYRASDAELRSRRLVLSLHHRTWPFGSPKDVGSCFVTLMDIASGPHRFDLPLLNPSGSHAGGRIVFQVQMVQQCRLSVHVPSVTCTMRALARHTSQASQEAAHQMASYSLATSLTMAEAESPPTRCDFDSKALKLTEKAQVLMSLPESEKKDPKIAIVAQASAGAFDKESLHLCVWESTNGPQQQQVGMASGRLTPPPHGGPTPRSFGVAKQRLLGEVWLPVTKVHAPTEKRTYDGKFSEVLWLHGQRIGRLEGVVRISNGPKFMQLPAGFFTEMGIVPVGPIAAGTANGSDSLTSASPQTPGYGSAVDAVTSNSLQDFEQTPKGLVLPKEVEQVVSLVTSLRNVLLELHLDVHADAHEAAGTDDEGNGRGVSDLLSDRRSGGGGGDRIERSLSSDRLGLTNERLRTNRLSGDASNGMGKRSSSADRMSEAGNLTSPQRSAGRLANAEMAARRLMFLLRRLQLLLDLSSKESCKAFFYSSVPSLQWTQRLMIRLWAYLLSQLDAVAFRFQPAIFETLRILMQRGEVDCSAMMEAPTSLLERYRKVLWETTAYVISKLSHKAAPTEVRVFCSQALSVAFFRLPALRAELLKIILPPGESRHKHVREWNLPWSLQKSALREADASGSQVHAGGLQKRASWFARSYWQTCFSNAAASAASGLGMSIDPLASERVSASDPSAAQQEGASTNGELTAGKLHAPSPRGSPRSARRASSSHSVVSDSSSVATGQARCASSVDATEASATPTPGAPPVLRDGSDLMDLDLDQWSQLWRTRLDSASNVSERSLAGRYWRERLRKRGHCFFLFFEHWLNHTSMAMGTQPGEAVTWKAVPGAPTLMKAFLLEMKQRPIHHWPESMVSCMVMLVKENRQILQVCVRILLSRVGTALHLRTSLASLQHLDALMKALAPEPLPQTFSAQPLLHTLHHLAESEHFKVAASALIFLYNHLDTLGDGARLDSLGWLHERFAAFALHWSRVVRTIYLHLAVIKVINWTPPPSTSPSASLKTRSTKDLEALMPGSVRSLSNGGSGSQSNGGGEIEKLLARESRRSMSGSTATNGNGHNGHNNGGSFDGSSFGSSSTLNPASVRDFENLLEFHRLRDLYTDSIASLGKLAKAAAAMQPLHAAQHPAAASRGAGRAGGGGRGGRGRGGGWRQRTSGGGTVSVSGWGRRSSRAVTTDKPDEELTPEAARAAAVKAKATIEQAASELGLGSVSSFSMKHTLEYSVYAWTEYEQVVKKWEAAQATLARPDDGGAALSTSASVIGKSASCGMLPSDNAPIRRSLSEPSLPAAPNPLALSLSMIASHVHDDEDEMGADHEEW